MPNLDPKTKEMVAIAASVAGNCIPCLRYHFEQALKEGCTKEEIQEVLEVSNMVKQRPINEINRTALSLLQNVEKRG
jgi:AhpD family alkylhydroperoxidase